MLAVGQAGQRVVQRPVHQARLHRAALVQVEGGDRDERRGAVVAARGPEEQRHRPRQRVAGRADGALDLGGVRLSGDEPGEPSAQHPGLLAGEQRGQRPPDQIGRPGFGQAAERRVRVDDDAVRLEDGLRDRRRVEERLVVDEPFEGTGRRPAAAAWSLSVSLVIPDRLRPAPSAGARPAALGHTEDCPLPRRPAGSPAGRTALRGAGVLEVRRDRGPRGQPSRRSSSRRARSISNQTRVSSSRWTPQRSAIWATR